MPISVAAPPQRVPIFSGFDYMAVDEAHRRVYAAHTASRRLLIVDSENGRVLAQVNVGPMHGVAVDSQTGAVFTGNGTDRSISEVDPIDAKVTHSVAVPGDIDAIAYDPSHHRIYADQDGGGAVYVVDAATFKFLGTVVMPANDLESPAIDPATGILYQNLANGGGFAIVDPASLKVVSVVETPQLRNNHALVFASGAKQVIVGGVNGVLSAYTPEGEHVGDVRVQPRIDQCSTGSAGKLIACAGRGIVTVVATKNGAPPRVVGRLDTGHATLHTIGIDESRDDVWVVFSDASGDWVQRLNWAP